MAGGIWLAGSENLNLESSGMNGIEYKLDFKINSIFRTKHLF